MREFMRKQVGSFKQPKIEEKILFCAIVARLVMLHAILWHAIAQREQEIVPAVVPPAEDGPGFRHQLAKVLHFGGCRFQWRGTIGSDVHHMRRRLARGKVNVPQVRARDDRGIDHSR